MFSRKPVLIKALMLLSVSSAMVPMAARAEPVRPIPLLIASQNLGSALNEFARQTNQQIMFAPALVRGKRARAISGSYEPNRALRQLLDGTGITYRATPSGAFLLLAAQKLDSAGGTGTVTPVDNPEPGRPPAIPHQPRQNESASPAEVGQLGEHDVIVVTAQKRSERLSDVPLSVTAVSGDRLVELGVSSPADLEKVALGFNYRPSPQGSPVFQIRGIGFFEEAIGVAPTVSVYLDQAPLPFSSMAEGAAFDLERVEVLKGPQGTLFGQNVTGGAINYIAAKPTQTLRMGVDGTYGRFDAVDLGGFISGPLSSTLTARVAARVERRGDWQRTYTRLNSAGLYVTDTSAPHRGLGSRQFDVGRLLLNWRPSDRVELQLNVNGWRNQSETQAQQVFALTPNTPANTFNVPNWPQFAGFPQAPKNNRYADWDSDRSYRRDDRFFQISLRGDFELDDGLDLTSITSYSDLDASRPVDLDGTPLFNLFTINGGRLKSFSQELRLAGSNDAERLKWMVGGNYAHDDTDELQTFLFHGTLSEPFFDSADQDMDGTVETWSAFAGIDFKVTETLTTQGSVRYTKQDRNILACTRDTGDGTFSDFVSLVFGLPQLPPGACTTIDTATFQPGAVRDSFSEDNVAWRLGLDWKPAPELMLYANATKGYKAGNFVNITAIFSNSLEPVPQESLLSFEVGFKALALQRRLQLTGAAFYYDYQDKQLTGFRDGGVFGTLNSVVTVPKSRVTGVEFEAVVRPIEGLIVRGGTTYIDSQVTGDFLALDSVGVAVNRKGESFPGTPKWASIGDIEYELEFSSDWNAFVGGNVAYRSKSRTYFGGSPLFHIPSYTLVDLRVGFGSRDDRYRVQFFGRNIFDKYYVLIAQQTMDNVTRVAGMPATYGISFTARY